MKFSSISILATVAVLVFTGCNKKNEKAQDMGPRPVDVAYPSIDSVTLYKTYPGYLSSNQKVDVVGRVNGQLLSQNFHDGDYVQKGQVLFTIESSTYRNAVEKARGDLATAKSQYEYAKRNYNAMNLALKEDAVAEISVIQAESDMRQAAAAIKMAEAALADASTNLSYCTVTAPISGRITSPTLAVGTYINGAAMPETLATIYDESSLFVTFSIEENQYDLLLNAGAAAEGSIYRTLPLIFKENLPHSYTANLNYSSPSVDKTTGTIELKGGVDNPHRELRDGMYVTVKLPYGTEPHALLIPDASIGTDQRGKYVYVVNDSNKVVYTPITVGDLYRDSLRIVESGLTPQSRFVTKALLTVRGGETVKPVVTNR